MNIIENEIALKAVLANEDHWHFHEADAATRKDPRWVGHSLKAVGYGIYTAFHSKCSCDLHFTAAVAADGFEMSYYILGRIKQTTQFFKFETAAQLHDFYVTTRDQFLTQARTVEVNRKATIKGMKEETRGIFGDSVNYKVKNVAEIIVYGDGGDANIHIRKADAKNTKDGKDIFFIQGNFKLDREELEIFVELMKRKAVLHKMRSVE